MDDPFDRLSEQEIADACAYADGTLPRARRAEVEARVVASPELTALVERQKTALAATAALGEVEVPASLRDSVEALGSSGSAASRRPRATGPRRARRRWALSAAAVLAAVLVVFVLLDIGGGSVQPSVAATADLALQPPSGPAPAVASAGRLDASVGGISFPDYRPASGWKASGSRSGEVAGRPATVVYYEKDGQRVGYAIVNGAALPLPHGVAGTTRSGVEYVSFERQGQNVVTWREAGHTCVLAGPVPVSELATLAGGPATY